MSVGPQVVAGAQIFLSLVYILGYLGILAAFLMGYIRTPETWKDQLSVMLGVLTGGVMLILQFWFSRERGVFDGKATKEHGAREEPSRVPEGT